MATKRKRQIIIRVRELSKRWYVSIAEVENPAMPARSLALPSVRLKRHAVRQAEALAAQYRFDGCDVLLDKVAYKFDRRRRDWVRPV